MGGGGLSQTHPLQPARQGRTFRRLGAAGTVRLRGPHGAPEAALSVRSSAQAVARRATEWLAFEPLGPVELRGHVVLVDVCALTCINWLREESQPANRCL